MKDVIAAAKKAPKKVNVAIGTIGGSEHICAHRVAKAAGVEFNIVAFKGGGEAAAALLGGHVDLSFGNVQEQMGQIEAKKVRALATMTERTDPFHAGCADDERSGDQCGLYAVQGILGGPGVSRLRRQVLGRHLRKTDESAGIQGLPEVHPGGGSPSSSMRISRSTS